MSKAIYSTKNIGHFGLAFPYYTHFTSPIRRYPDVLVHRYLARYLADEKVPEEERDALEGELLHASAKEVVAQEAERDSIKYKQIEYMSSRIGETFTGIVSGVTDWGFFVEDGATRAEGLVRARDLTDDFYSYDEKTETLVGQKNGRRFRLGDTVKFTVADTDIKRRQMTYHLAN
jgi:ribonuclease R